MSRAGGRTSFSYRPKLPQGLTELLEGRAWAWVERWVWAQPLRGGQVDGSRSSLFKNCVNQMSSGAGPGCWIELVNQSRPIVSASVNTL